jgi:hypothetical protein
MSPRLRDIVADLLEGDPQLEIIEGSIEDLQPAPDDRCHVLVTEAADEHADRRARELLTLLPRGRIVVITAKGDRAIVCEQRQQTLLAEVSPRELARAIRGTLRPFDT